MRMNMMEIGMCVGLLVRVSPGNVVQNMISFKSTILLNVLLPPIILNSGYQLKQVRTARSSWLSVLWLLDRKANTDLLCLMDVDDQ